MPKQDNGGPTVTVAQKRRRDPIVGRRAIALVATLILGVLSYQLNASMITPALPDIARSLGEDVTEVSQVSSLFFLAGAIGGIVLSRWSDFIGRRNALIVVLVILGIGTLLCVFAPSLPVLLVGRVLQGASSAAFQLAYVILSEALSRRAFGTTLGIITAVNGGVGGADGYIGGLLSERFGFRSIFILIFVVGIFALLCVIQVVPADEKTAGTETMDWWGSVVLSVGLICMTFFVSQAGQSGWLSTTTLTYLAGAVVAMAAFWLVEKRRTTALIAVHHLRSRQVWPVIVTTMLTLTGIFAVVNFTVVLLSQDTSVGFGLDAATAALMFLAPAALIGVFSAPLAGWLAGRYGWLRILRTGLLLSIAAISTAAVFPHDRWIVFVAIAVLGVAYNGLALTTVNGLGVLLSPEDAPAALPGLNGAAFGFGASLGITIVAPFVAWSTITGFATALWISSGITLLALIVSLFIAPRHGERL